ncbi:MAG: 3'-5' exonuclease [Clostridia bacterium]|nr:3'-5' exonuclease [Clostridia bacterium]
MFDRFFRDFEQILVLDTETTGIRPASDEIIELGMTSLSPRGEMEADFLITLSPGKLLPPEITRLTGITRERLSSEGVSKAEAAEAFSAMVGGKKTLLAAYNAQFDLNFLFYFLKREGKADSLRGVKFLDVLTVYRDRKPYPHRLGDAVNAYRLTTPNTHRALDDVHAAVAVMAAMEAEKDDLDRYVNLFGVHPKYGLAGRPIGSVVYRKQEYDPAAPLYENEIDPAADPG